MLKTQLQEKDAEIQRLKALLKERKHEQLHQNDVSATSSSPPDEKGWVHLETRLRASTMEDEANMQHVEVTQPYECVLKGQGALGFQLTRVLVAVRRDGSEGGSLSKLYALSNSGVNAQLAAPFVLQERAVVLKVEAGGTAQNAGVVAGSTLRALNGQSVLHLTYANTLQTIRSAVRPLRLLFTPPETSDKVEGDAFVSSDTVVLDYTEATPALARQTDALADVAQELGTYLNHVEDSSKRVVDLGKAFCTALVEFGLAIDSGGRGGRTNSNKDSDRDKEGKGNGNGNGNGKGKGKER